MEQILNEDYVLMGWPEVQRFMGKGEFYSHSALINENESMGIGSCTYLVEREWYDDQIKK